MAMGPLVSSAVLILSLFGSPATADIFSCPGVIYLPSGTASINGLCCVGGVLTPPHLSNCPGWPICSGPSTTTQHTSPLSCATLIPVSDNSYSDLVASASASLQQSGTHIQTTITGPITAAPQTSLGSNSGGTATDSSNGSSSGGQTSTDGAVGLAAEVVAIGVGLLGVAALL